MVQICDEKIKKGVTMNCPVCKDERLAISDKNGIEIDYCPRCRGIWLDRGELDKIIERSVGSSEPRGSYNDRDDRHNSYSQKSYSDDRYKDDKYRGSHNGYHHKKKESFLSDLFDF